MSENQANVALDFRSLSFLALTSFYLAYQVLHLREDHQQKVDNVEKLHITPASDALKSKNHWMQCVVQNSTQFPIAHVPPEYFDSGRYHESAPPVDVEPYSNMVFAVCNRDFALTGATGGTAFRVDVSPGNFCNFAVGWNTPLSGSYKAGVAQSTKAEDGYKASNENGGSIQSEKIFKGLDKDGKEVHFRIEVTATPGVQARYGVKQLPVP